MNRVGVVGRAWQGHSFSTARIAARQKGTTLRAVRFPHPAGKERSFFDKHSSAAVPTSPLRWFRRDLRNFLPVAQLPLGNPQ
jgi:hypothetical protein